MSLSPGTRLGHFEITAHIGSGRLGEVYRAQNIELDHVVAIRVLPEGAALDAEWLVSLEQKVRTVMSLSHPNVGLLHGLEKEGGLRFLVLEFVIGTTLADHVKVDPLSINRALTLFIQVAKGLEAAHENRIIHGNLKLANIKVAPAGEGKVLDFGLAESIRTLQPSSCTVGESDGATTCVSPEQALGQEADERSDIWAFGCCLYEALTGSAPFLAEANSDRTSGNPEQDPNWDLLPSTLPEVVGELIRRCLERESESRFSSAGEMITILEEAQEALKRNAEAVLPKQKLSVVASLPIVASIFIVLVGFGSAFWLDRANQPSREHTREAGVVSIRSLAVLPLEDLSEGRDQEAFADRMRDALVRELSRSSSLTIKSLDPMRTYHDSDKTIREIAQELGVDAVVTGSAFKKEDEVQIELALVDGRTESELWTHSYTSPFEKSLGLQSEAAFAIANETGAAIIP
jgi:serine/threonine protein kinase